MATRTKIGSFKAQGGTKVRLFVDSRHAMAIPKQKPHSSLGTFFNNVRKFDCFGLFKKRNAISPEPENPIIVESTGLPDDLIQKKPLRSSIDYMSDMESTEARHSSSSSTTTIDSLYMSHRRHTKKLRAEELRQIEVAQRGMKPKINL